jgi:hypothetical protein
VQERFRWSVLALTQEADVQMKLFPDFVVVADELALNWESAPEKLRTSEPEISDSQKSPIEKLDQLISAISGPEHLEFWEDDALSERIEWDEIRLAARAVAQAFGWPIAAPPPSPDFYVGPPDKGK